MNSISSVFTCAVIYSMLEIERSSEWFSTYKTYMKLASSGVLFFSITPLFPATLSCNCRVQWWMDVFFVNVQHNGPVVKPEYCMRWNVTKKTFSVNCWHSYRQTVKTGWLIECLVFRPSSAATHTLSLSLLLPSYSLTNTLYNTAGCNT